MAKFNNRFDDTEDCKLYITSDLHLNHKQEFLWGKRGYKDAEEHTNKLIQTINETCRPQDILFMLGDACLNTSYEAFEPLFDRILCQQWWLKGNHNNPWEKLYREDCKNIISDFSNISETFPTEVLGYSPFEKVTIWGNYLEFVWNGQMCTFFHYPIAIWNQMHHGAWNLCGHSHGSYPLSQITNTTCKQLDCGWELHDKPLSFKEIKLIMNKKGIKKSDHHDKETN